MVVFAQPQKEDVRLARRSPPPWDVVLHHTPGRECQPDSRVVETWGESLQGSGQQPVVRVDELDAGATREFQAFVVVLIEAESRFIADQSVSGSQHCCGDRGTIV